MYKDRLSVLVLLEETQSPSLTALAFYIKPRFGSFQIHPNVSVPAS
jgi:hypothetical protein